MPPRRKRNSSKATRSWRRGPEPGRSVLTKGRRRARARQPSRFTVLEPPKEKVEPSPLYKIPSLRPWLAARELMAWDRRAAHHAG